MKLLLDTHTFLWFILDDPHLSRHARDLMEDDQHELFLSAASHWEIAIKSSLGKLTLAEPFATLLPREIRLNDVQLLSVELSHTAVVAGLPHHHKDPFDRLLIAQAIVERMPIVGIDGAFDAYSVTRLW